MQWRPVARRRRLDAEPERRRALRITDHGLIGRAHIERIEWDVVMDDDMHLQLPLGSAPAWRKLRLHPLIEARDIDHETLVRTVADQVLLVVRLDPEFERAPFDRKQPCGGAHP